jgi:hypothetical protein
MAMPDGIEPQKAACRNCRTHGIQEVRMETVSALGQENPPARLHNPGAHVISEHDCVEQFGARRTLSFGYC